MRPGDQPGRVLTTALTSASSLQTGVLVLATFRFLTRFLRIDFRRTESKDYLPGSRTGDHPIGEQLNSLSHPVARFFALFSVILAGMLGASAAQAAGTPDLQLAATSSSPLYGQTGTASSSAALANGQPKGYNLSFRAVLPAGISYSGGAEFPPQVINNAPAAGQTTLIFSNISDLIANSTQPVALEPGPRPEHLRSRRHLRRLLGGVRQYGSALRAEIRRLRHRRSRAPTPVPPPRLRPRPSRRSRSPSPSPAGRARSSAEFTTTRRSTR